MFNSLQTLIARIILKNSRHDPLEYAVQLLVYELAKNLETPTVGRVSRQKLLNELWQRNSNG